MSALLPLAIKYSSNAVCTWLKISPALADWEFVSQVGVRFLAPKAWGAEHGGLAGGAFALPGAVSGRARPQGAAADFPALCGGADRAGRSQERRPDGRADRAGRLRPASSFRVGRDLV